MFLKEIAPPGAEGRGEGDPLRDQSPRGGVPEGVLLEGVRLEGELRAGWREGEGEGLVVLPNLEREPGFVVIGDLFWCSCMSVETLHKFLTS